MTCLYIRSGEMVEAGERREIYPHVSWLVPIRGAGLSQGSVTAEPIKQLTPA